MFQLNPTAGYQDQGYQPDINVFCTPDTVIPRHNESEGTVKSPVHYNRVRHNPPFFC